MARKDRRKKKAVQRTSETDSAAGQELRIIGGRKRGSKLRYHGDPVVRPMKHRVREAIFNLISTDSAGRHAIDLFAGTGALGLEAVSRGADGATFLEMHVPSARIVEENIARLDLANVTTLCVTSTFLWARRDLPGLPAQISQPWLVFCSPPYAFFQDRHSEMLDLLQRIRECAPAESILIVESDDRFDFASLSGEWDIRNYPPAIIGVQRL